MDGSEDSDDSIGRGRRRKSCMIHSSNDEDSEMDATDGSGSEEDGSSDEGGGSDGAASAGSSSGSESSDVCPICLSSFRGQEIGNPESCDHNFCLDHILEWAKNVTTCPVDRQPFTLVLVRREPGGKITRKITIDKKDLLDAQEEEDPTYCEVCGRCDREDRLLLCDGCDSGYHLDCLDPVLERVPEEQWFCPECAPLHDNPTTLAAEVGISQEELMALLDDPAYDSELPARRQLSRPGRPVVARTRLAERIRRRAPPVTDSPSSQQRPMFGGTTSSRSRARSAAATSSATARPKSKPRRRKTCRTKSKTGTTKSKSRKTGKRRRKTKRKTKRSVRRHRDEPDPYDRTRQHLRRLLAIRRLKPGQVAPPAMGVVNRVRVGASPSVVGVAAAARSSIHVQRHRAGIQPLHLFGRRDDLLAVSDDDEDRTPAELGSAAALVARRRVGASLSRLKRSQLTTPASPTLAEPAQGDVLASIMSSQSLLLARSSRMRIERDGRLSLVAPASSGARAAAAGSPPQESSSSSPSYLTAGGGVAASSSATRLQPDSAGTQSVGGGPAGAIGDSGSRSLSPTSSSVQNNGGCLSGLVLPKSPPKHKPDQLQPCLPKTSPPVAKPRFFSDTPSGSRPVASGENTRACVSPTSLPAEGAVPSGFGTVVSPLSPVQRALLDNGVAGLYEFPPASPVYFRSSATASPVRLAGSSPSRPASDGSRSPTASVPGGGGSYAAYYAQQTSAARSPTTVASSVAGTGDRTPTYSTCSRDDEQVDLYSDIEPPDAESAPSPDEQDSEDGETDAQVVVPLLATSVAALAKKADTMLAAGVQYASDVSSDEDLVIDDSVRRSTSRSPRSAAYIQPSDKCDEISKSVVTNSAAWSSCDENSAKVSQITVGKVSPSDDGSNAVSKNAAAKAGTSSYSDDDSNKISKVSSTKTGTLSSDDDGDNISEITSAKANTLSSSDEDGDIRGKIITKPIYSYSDESVDKVKITAAGTDSSSSDEGSVKDKVNAKAGASSSDQSDGNSNKNTTGASISPPRQHLLSSGTVSLESVGRWRPLPAGGSAFNIPLPPTVGVPSPSEIPLPPVTETISSPESFGADLDEPTARQHRISRDLADIFGSGSPARQTQPALDDIPIPDGSFHGLPDTEQISDSEEPNEFDDGMEDGEIPAPVLLRISPQPCSSSTALSSTAGVFGDHSREGDFEEGEIPPPATMGKSPATLGNSPAARDGVNSDDDGEIIDPLAQSQLEGAMDTSDDKSSGAPSKCTERGGDDEGLVEEDQIIVENYENPVVEQNTTVLRNHNTTSGSCVLDEEVEGFVVVEKTCSNLRLEDGDETADISWKKVSKSSRDRHYRGDVSRPDWNDKVRPLERSVGELVSGSGGRPNDWCGVKSGAPVVSASGADDVAAQTLERNDVRRVIIDRRKSRRDRQSRSSSSSSSRDSGTDGKRCRHGSGRRRRSLLPRSPRRSSRPRSPRRSPSLRVRSGGDRRRGASPSRRRSSPKRRRVWVSRSPSPPSRSAGRKRSGNVPSRNRSRDRRRSRRSPSPEPKKMRKKKEKEKKSIKGDKKKRKKRDKASVSKAVIADGDNLVVSVNFPKNKSKTIGKPKSGKKVRPSKKGAKVKTKRAVVADISMYSPERHEEPPVDDVPIRCSPARVSSPPAAPRRQSTSMERASVVPVVAESVNAPGSGAEDMSASRLYRRPARNGNHSGSESPRSTRRPAGAAGDSSSSESPGRSAWRPAGGALCRPPQLSPVDMDVVIVPTSDNEPILITDSEDSDSDRHLAGGQSPEPVAAPTVGASSPPVASGRSDAEEQDKDGEPALTVQQRLDAVLGALTARSPRGPHTPSEPGSPPQHVAVAESAGVKFRLANRAVTAVTLKVRTLTNPLLAEEEEPTSPAQPLSSASAPRGPSTPPEPPPVDTYDPFEPTNSPRSPPSPSGSASPVASDQPAPAAASPAQSQQPLTAAAVFNSLLFARPPNKAADAPPMKNLLDVSTSLFAGLPPPKASSTAAAPQSSSKSDSSRLSLSVAATASSSCTPPAAAAPLQSAATPAASAVNGQATAALSPPSPPHPATDMDVDSPPSPESPRSPDSREADDLFEPPSGLSVPPSTTAPVAAAPATLPFSFDALFGGSAPRSATKRRGATTTTTTAAAAGARPKVARNGQRTTVKAVGKRDRLSGFTEMDEDNLRVLDDVPNSAVEMEYLKKLNRQERVIEEVKLVLKPFYQKRTVTKAQYKDILRKSVPKICHSKSGEINPNKIQTLVVGYVKKCRYENKKTGVLKEKPVAAKRSSSKVRV